VPTLHNEDSALATDILAVLRRKFAGHVVPMVVHEDEIVREATSFGQPVIEYAPDSRACDDLEKLADWLDDHPPREDVEIEVVRTPGQFMGPNMTPPAPADSAQDLAVIGGDAVVSRAVEIARRVRGLQVQVEPSQTGAGAGQDDDGLHAPAGEQSQVFGPSVTNRGVRFAHPGDDRTTVYVAGDFNDWSATSTPLRYDDRIGAHETVIEMPPGRYCYRFIVNGRWTADPHNQYKQVNEYGEFNSVVVVSAAGDPS